MDTRNGGLLGTRERRANHTTLLTSADIEQALARLDQLGAFSSLQCVGQCLALIRQERRLSGVHQSRRVGPLFKPRNSLLSAKLNDGAGATVAGPGVIGKGEVIVAEAVRIDAIERLRLER